MINPIAYKIISMTNNNQQSQLYGFFLVAAATALFSCKAIVIKIAYQYGAEADIFMILRMLFSLPVYIFIAMQARRTYNAPIHSSTLFMTGAFGISGFYLASVFDLYGLQYISASLERLILYVYPTIVVILSILFLGARLSKQLVICIGVIYVGLLIAFTQDTSTPSTDMVQTFMGDIPALYLGSGFIFIAALSFAVYLTGSELMMRKLPSRLFTAYAMLAASVVIMGHFLINQPFGSLFTQTKEIYLITLFTAMFCTVAPTFMLSSGIQKIGAPKAGIIGSLGPVLTIALAGLHCHYRGQLIGQSKKLT
jgi:drug/metabolite transporter (DMT)-like permease